jgi:hypothetical protein
MAVAASRGAHRASDRLSVAPGGYTLAAWETIEPFGFFDPDNIAHVQTTGKTIQVAESSNQAVSLTAIPASDR